MNKTKPRTCLVNVGLFRSGTTTLCEAVKQLGHDTYREFPNLSKDEHRMFLKAPGEAILSWFNNGGIDQIVNLAKDCSIICDGWLLKTKAKLENIRLVFVATRRDIDACVRSELQHWTLHDLEKKAGFSSSDRDRLERDLRKRAEEHRIRVLELYEIGFLKKLLPLSDHLESRWSSELADITDFTHEQWSRALNVAGKCNANPPLPTEGILLTLSLKYDAEHKTAAIENLLTQLEQDQLCRYLFVLALDDDDSGASAAKILLQKLKARSDSAKKQMQSLHVITNPKRSAQVPFPICSVWNEMAKVAWANGADWVTLLGDDIEVKCSYHYRAIYRAFLDISNNLKVPFGFGCPWWNDESFPGFATFPCVGKVHYEIFGGLIPEHRLGVFHNQDLDPYLHILYVKFHAAPCVLDAVLNNNIGGNIGAGEARYQRMEAVGWKDFVLSDLDYVRSYLKKNKPEEIIKENILLDIIVPSYRVRLDYLLSICQLHVPENIHSNFIIIVDNPEELCRRVRDLIQDETEISLCDAERILENYLSQGGNRVRVRCNDKNLGASESRNRGLNESVSEFVLNLDDDLIPYLDLLEQYGSRLFDLDEDIVGLVGLVKFPRSSTLPLKHAAVLMSYLTFVFEVAERRDMYGEQGPAWGVTANILFRRTPVRFDLVYAKTGGGEDVAYSLDVLKRYKNGRLLAVPEACVVHPFWPGSVVTLAKHFYSWAIGDGALFERFPQYCYWSFPNVPEMVLIVSPLTYWFGLRVFFQLVGWFLAMDFAMDYFHSTEFEHRCRVLEASGRNGPMISRRSRWFYFGSHVLANLYVAVLEFGRLRGHIGRFDLAHGPFRRFDWHIGRLENASRNFRRREAGKFILFVAILASKIIVWMSSQE